MMWDFKEERKELEKEIPKAIIFGAMEGEIEWFPIEVKTLKKKLDWHARAIKATPYDFKKREHFERCQDIETQLLALNPDCCKRFATKLFLAKYESARSFGGYTNMLESTTEVDFYINFSNPEKFKVRWVIKKSSNYKFTAYSSRVVHDLYYTLPSLVLNNVVLSESEIKRYEYVYGSGSRR